MQHVSLRTTADELATYANQIRQLRRAEDAFMEDPTFTTARRLYHARGQLRAFHEYYDDIFQLADVMPRRSGTGLT